LIHSNWIFNNDFFYVDVRETMFLLIFNFLIISCEKWWIFIFVNSQISSLNFSWGLKNERRVWADCELFKNINFILNFLRNNID
jgi:hypothetical protein